MSSLLVCGQTEAVKAKLVLAVLAAAALIGALPQLAHLAQGWSVEHALKARIEASNAEYDRKFHPRIGLVQDPQVDLDRQDQVAACLPVDGVVDKARCAAANPPRPIPGQPVFN